MNLLGVEAPPLDHVDPLKNMNSLGAEALPLDHVGPPCLRDYDNASIL